jgi:membrane protein YdbS with pleckstrin-like domain
VAYPDDLLTEGEQIIIHEHPHWKMLILPVFVFLVTIGLGAFLASLVAAQSWHVAAWIVLAVIGLGLIGWLTIAPLIRWLTTHFVVTTRRVIVREGVITRQGIDIPMSRISSVRFTQGPVERMLGCGTLIIESSSDEPLDFEDIPHVQQVHNVLYQEVAEEA